MKHATSLHLQAHTQGVRMAGGLAPGPRGSTGPHILLVDDDVSLLKLLGMRLESRGFRVTTAESGREALGRAAPCAALRHDLDVHQGQRWQTPAIAVGHPFRNLEPCPCPP